MPNQVEAKSHGAIKHRISILFDFMRFDVHLFNFDL